MVGRESRCTFRLRVDSDELGELGGDVDRLLEEADRVGLSPPFRGLLLMLDDEISQRLAGRDGGEPPPPPQPRLRRSRPPAGANGRRAADGARRRAR